MDWKLIWKENEKKTPQHFNQIEQVFLVDSLENDRDRLALRKRKRNRRNGINQANGNQNRIIPHVAKHKHDSNISMQMKMEKYYQNVFGWSFLFPAINCCEIVQNINLFFWKIEIQFRIEKNIRIYSMFLDLYVLANEIFIKILPTFSETNVELNMSTLNLWKFINFNETESVFSCFHFALAQSYHGF